MKNSKHSNPRAYVESLVVGDFNESQLKELFHSATYRRYADEIFEDAVAVGNRNISPESILWWQEAVATEQQPESFQQLPENPTVASEPDEKTKKKDGGEIYLILMALFLIAYGIKYLME